jgi:hypothetical protein
MHVYNLGEQQGASYYMLIRETSGTSVISSSALAESGEKYANQYAYKSSSSLLFSLKTSEQQIFFTQPTYSF